MRIGWLLLNCNQSKLTRRATNPPLILLTQRWLNCSGEWKVFSGNELGALLGWWMWTRAEQKGQDPKTAAMIASTVSSKILQTMAEREGFLFDETLTGFKWMANRGLQLQKEGYQILFAFEGSLDKLDTHWLVLVNRMDSLYPYRGYWIYVRHSRSG